MELRSGGLDIFYIDESERHPLSFVSSVRVPMIRYREGGWHFVWQEYLAKAVTWRKALSESHDIRFRAELHGSEILAHRGLLKKGRRNLRPDEAVALYEDALATLNFLPPGSVMTAFADGGSELMGHKGIKAAMLGLFQRIRRQCGSNTNGLIIFDDGHPEYIAHYRRATKFLPTGSMHGGWAGSSTANLPLDMFPKDANLKASNLSLFLQVADLVVNSARLKVEKERGTLTQKRVGRGHGAIYDSLHTETKNLAATNKRPDKIIPV